MKWQDRVKKLTKERGWSQYDLADRLGHSQPYVNQILNSKRGASLKVLEKFAKIFDVPTEYFLSGVTRKEKPVISIPVLNEHQIEAWLDAPETLKNSVDEWMPVVSEYGLRSYAIRFYGKDMCGGANSQYNYPPGAILIVNPEKSKMVGSRVIVQLPDKRVVFRELEQSAGEFFLSALKPGFPMISLGVEFNARFLGQVVATIVREEI